MKACVIIPTLNEEKNIYKIFNKIKSTKIKLDILFIDDNSKDASQNIIKNLKKKFKYVMYIFRNSKTGIGSAHKEGIKYCYKKKYDLIITIFNSIFMGRSYTNFIMPKNIFNIFKFFF